MGLSPQARRVLASLFFLQLFELFLLNLFRAALPAPHLPVDGPLAAGASRACLSLFFAAF